jgi:peptide/nickel transport system substrate-binding protein
LSEGRPQVLPLGRQFHIAPGAIWAESKPITAADVKATLALLRNPKWRGYSPAWEEMYDNAQAGSDPAHVNVLLRQGFVDPLSLMTFKVLPTQTNAANEKALAENPAGSGPYQYKGEGTSKDRKCLIFTANPLYANRPAKYRDGVPQIREIQFIPLSADPAKDLGDGVVDFIPDLPSGSVQAVQALGGKAVLPPQPTRRIYFLAVNHRRTRLQNENLRKAIAHAIPREELLRKSFRGTQDAKVHRVLTGPYPPGSWACDPTLKYEQAKANGFINAEPSLKTVGLTLACPDDDPRVVAAMEELARAVKTVIGVDIKVLPQPPRDLRVTVEETFAYDLAYYYYDFPSDAYWLWPLFHPNGLEPRQGNYLGYADDQLGRLLGQMNGRRDIRELQKQAHLVHGRIFDKMPLIPLWQLDRHAAFAVGVKPVAFDPLLVFEDVEQWRLEKK